MGERSFSKSWGLRASGSFVPLPLPRHSCFFCSCPSFLDEPREETLATQARLALACAAKEYPRRISIIWSSPQSDCNRVQATNQYALPVLRYLMWTQHWPLSELRDVDRAALKIIVENGGKHPASLTSLLYLPREKGVRGLRSVELEYKITKIKSLLKLYLVSEFGPTIQTRL